MKRIEKLRGELRGLLKQLEDMLSLAEKEDRHLTEEEEVQYAETEKDVEKCQNALQRELRAQERSEMLSTVPGNQAPPATPEQRGTIEVGDMRETKRPFNNMGDFLQSVRAAESKGAQIDPRLFEIRAATGAGESIDADGGFLVQTDYIQTLLQRTYSDGEILSRVAPIPVSANSNGIEIPAINETSRATGSRFGGIRVYWTEEGGTPTATKPAYRTIGLKLKKIMALSYASDELIADASAHAAYINQILPMAIRYRLEDAIINGTGSGQPLGVLNSPSLISVDAETGQAAATIIYENIVNMWARMWAPSRRNAVWFISQDCEPQLMQMYLAVGTGGVPAYLPANGLSGSPYGTLLGRPVIPVEQCAAVGTVGDIMLADLSQYIMIDKGGMQSASSIHVQFVTDEMTYRWTYRCDGQSWWNSALTPANAGATLSPFIALATRS